MQRGTLAAPAQARDHTPGVYVPQLGDEAVYIPEGHRICLHNTRDKRAGPWHTVVAPRVRPAPGGVPAGPASLCVRAATPSAGRASPAAAGPRLGWPSWRARLGSSSSGRATEQARAALACRHVGPMQAVARGPAGPAVCNGAAGAQTGERMRAAEPVRVVGLRYAISDDGRRDTASAPSAPACLTRRSAVRAGWRLRQMLLSVGAGCDMQPGRLMCCSEQTCILLCFYVHRCLCPHCRRYGLNCHAARTACRAPAALPGRRLTGSGAVCQAPCGLTSRKACPPGHAGVPARAWRFCPDPNHSMQVAVLRPVPCDAAPPRAGRAALQP